MIGKGFITYFKKERRNVRKFISDIYRVSLPKTGLILKKSKQELVPIIQGALMPAKLQYLLAPKQVKLGEHNKHHNLLNHQQWLSSIMQKQPDQSCLQ